MSVDQTTRKVYVGLAPDCGCIMAGRLAEPFDNHFDQIFCADAVKDMIRGGLVVSRVDGPVQMTGHICGKENPAS